METVPAVWFVRTQRLGVVAVVCPFCRETHHQQLPIPFTELEDEFRAVCGGGWYVLQDLETALRDVAAPSAK